MSKMTMQGIVKGVEPRVIKSGTPDQRTVYDVIDQNNEKWTAWERPLAERAWELKDKTAVWTVEVKPASNPKYGPNRTLVNIEVGQTTDMHDAFGGGFPATPEPSPIPSAAPVVFDAPGSTMTAKDTSIHRQTAAKVVGAMAAASGMTADEFWSNMTDLVHYFETGETAVVREQAKAAQAAQDVHPNIANPTSSFPDFEEPQPDDDIPF